MSPRMTGARFIAETMKGYGITHVFFVEAILRRTPRRVGDLGDKARPDPLGKDSGLYGGWVRQGQSETGNLHGPISGGANMASGLQDPYLGRTPVIALTGRQTPNGHVSECLPGGHPSAFVPSSDQI